MLRIIRNKKGTAEVIGTIMAVVILLYFFTNVYLWNDAATKQMDEMYVDKMNTQIKVSLTGGNSNLTITNIGGSDVQLAMLWTDVGSGLSQTHYYDSRVNTIIIPAGSSQNITLPNPPTVETVYTVVTTLGNVASCSYNPS
jgi:hypothetical protein